MGTPEYYVSAIRELYRQHANPENAVQMKRYMKNQFEFFGLKKPERVELSKQVIQNQAIPEGETLKEVCRLCFQEDQREMQYFVYDLLGKRTKLLDDSFLDTFEVLILQKSWWDTVDFLAPKLAGKILLKYPNKISQYPGRWIQSENFWLQRSAILFQLDYKEKTNPQLLFSFIQKRADSKEFFLQKAAGWALREYSKTNPDAVREFIENNTLPKLTVREGSKRLDRT